MKVVISPGNKSLESLLSLSVSSTGIAFNVHVIEHFSALISDYFVISTHFVLISTLTKSTYLHTYKI